MSALLPGYFDGITDSASKRRYKEKLQYISDKDPYELKLTEWKNDLELWPSVTHVHVCMYLILTPSPYTEKDMLNYKSIDSYQNFVKGWVRRLLVMHISDNVVIIGKVNHSQRLNDNPLTPWIIAVKEGKILACHCACMAVFGESCSHVASLLWVVAIKKSKTCHSLERKERITLTAAVHPNKFKLIASNQRRK